MVITQRKKKNLQFWEERKSNMINKYLSPGVFIKEMDVSGVIYPRLSKRYSRRIKIGKIFGINVPIVTTPIGQNNFTQTKIW
jgi:hypothetical protein